MQKWITLIILGLLMTGSLITYVVLTENITAGTLKVAEGQQKIDEGEKMLAAGQAKLARGKRQLSQAKGTMGGLSSLPFMKTIEQTPGANIPFQVANQKISEGSQQVKNGEARIKAGEAQLAEGKEHLAQGKERLQNADTIRSVFGILSGLFGVSFIGLVVYWRKALFRKSQA